MNPSTDQPEEQTQNSVINSNIIAASVMKHTPDVVQPHSKTQLKRPMTFKLSHKHVSSVTNSFCLFFVVVFENIVFLSNLKKGYVW
jgi:hypothetical protein